MLRMNTCSFIFFFFGFFSFGPSTQIAELYLDGNAFFFHFDFLFFFQPPPSPPFTLTIPATMTTYTHVLLLTEALAELRKVATRMELGGPNSQSIPYCCPRASRSQMLRLERDITQTLLYKTH
jgi:hypothetical protein